MTGRRWFYSTIEDSAPPPSFISEWRTTNTSTGSSTSTQVKLPLLSSGNYNFNVDWGDGNNDNITVWNQSEVTHTYASSGDYTITITGVCEGWQFANTGDRLKILDISQWGVIKFLSQSVNNLGHFNGCANLDVTATDIPDFSLSNALAGFFLGCSSLVGNSSFNNWDLSGITTLQSFFQSCTLFNQDISSWDVSSVTSFQAMFQSAIAFNQNIGAWDLSSATSIAAMFNLASAFNNGGSDTIKNWDVSNVTSFGVANGGVFRSAVAFNQPIGIWDVSSGTSFRNAFTSATAFNQNIGAWDVSNAADLINFMSGKTAANYSAANLDAIYNGWSALTFVNTGLNINFGTIKYTAAGSAGKAILTGAPNNWTIVDGGI